MRDVPDETRNFNGEGKGETLDVSKNGDESFRQKWVKTHSPGKI
jgi:hypothetical protein